MKSKPVNQMNLEELKAAEAVYSKRADHAGELMLIRIREALAAMRPVNGRGNPVQPSRVGRVLVGAHFLPAVQRELKILAVREDKTMGDLLREALTDLFIKRGMPSVEKLEETK